MARIKRHGENILKYMNLLTSSGVYYSNMIKHSPLCSFTTFTSNFLRATLACNSVKILLKGKI